MMSVLVVFKPDPSGDDPDYVIADWEDAFYVPNVGDYVSLLANGTEYVVKRRWFLPINGGSSGTVFCYVLPAKEMPSNNVGCVTCGKTLVWYEDETGQVTRWRHKNLVKFYEYGAHPSVPATEKRTTASASYRSDPAGIGWDGTGDHMPGASSTENNQ